jgi:hypothetical protein
VELVLGRVPSRSLMVEIRHDPVKHTAERLDRPILSLGVALGVFPPVGECRSKRLLPLQVGVFRMLGCNGGLHPTD